MLDRETAKFISANLNVRRQVLTGGNEDVLTKLNRSIDLMDAIARGDTIASLWSIEDVQSLRTDDDGEVLAPDQGGVSDETAREVLRLADHNHDATIGINWDVLECHLDDVERGDA